MWEWVGRGYNFRHGMEDLAMLMCCGRRRAGGGEEPEGQDLFARPGDFEGASRQGRDRQGRVRGKAQTYFGVATVGAPKQPLSEEKDPRPVRTLKLVDR